MSKSDTFSTYNPVINFMFFIGAVVFGMFYTPAVLGMCCHPFIRISYNTYRDRRPAVSGRHGTAVHHPFSHKPAVQSKRSDDPFTYLGGRAYTLESLHYGMALAAMFISVIIWFASYNRVMTSDKFMYLWPGHRRSRWSCP